MANLKKSSCLTCSKYLTCRDKLKTQPGHFCEKFSRLREVSSMQEAFSFGIEVEPRVLEPKQVAKAKKVVAPSAKVSEVKKKKKASSIWDIDEDDIEDLTDEELNERVGGATGNFILDAMGDAYDEDTKTMRDLKIDDRDLPRARNYLHYCTDVAGKSIKVPFARQLWSMILGLAEYCPRCTKEKWYSDIYNIPVDMEIKDLTKRLILLENGKCPKCGAHKSELVLSGDLVAYNSIAMCWGQRSGKTSVATTVSTYHLHCVLKSPKLSSICRGIQDFTPLTYTFVGLSAARAIRLSWNPVRDLMNNSQWYKDYYAMLKFNQVKYGVELLKLGVLGTRFLHKNIDMYPLGPLKRALRGDSRLLSSVEEIGIFPIVNIAEDEFGEDEEREHANADEVWQSLENSLMTAREEISQLYRKDINTVPMALNLAISSPMSKKDKMCRLLEEAKNPDALMLGLQLPTWEVNPFMPRDSATIKSAYAKNPEKAERDFGASPPVLSAAAFTTKQVAGLFSKDRKNEHRIVYDADEKGLGRTLAHFIKEGTKTTWEPHILSLDAGLTNNAFALALGFKRDDGKLATTSVLEVVAKPGTRINFPYLYDSIILPLVKDCNVVVVGADRWNSIDMLQRLTEDTDNKVKTIQLSLQPKHFRYFETAVDNQAFDLPMLTMTPEEVVVVQDFKKDFVGKPVDHLLLQFLTVKYQLGVMTKGEGYTDDMLRALTVLYILAFNKKIIEYTTKFSTIGSGEGTDEQKKVTRGIVISGFRSPVMQRFNGQTNH